MASPLGLLLALAWNFVVLASLQLTIRLIRIFSVRTTFLAAVALTFPFVLVTAVYAAQPGRRLEPFWLGAAVMGVCGFAVARWVLRIRRQRGQLVAAIGTAILSSPWPAFLL